MSQMNVEKRTKSYTDYHEYAKKIEDEKEVDRFLLSFFKNVVKKGTEFIEGDMKYIFLSVNGTDIEFVDMNGVTCIVKPRVVLDWEQQIKRG